MDMEIYEQIKVDREAGTRRLVDEYRSRLTSAAEMLCKDHSDAEDLVFRAFEQAINKIDDFRPTGSFYYWIYTIMLNHHRMDLRKKAVRPVIVPHEELPDRADERANPYEQFVFKGSADVVRQAVQKLPDNFKEVVILRYFEDMSTGEIAKITGLNEGTVRSRLHYAKDALYAMLNDTELSPQFTERLIKATRRRSGWLGMLGRTAVASLAAVCCLFVIAATTAAITFKSAEEVKKEAESKAKLVGENKTSELWKMVGNGSTFSTEADEIDRSIEKALKFLISKQNESGAFNDKFGDTAAIPALVGMALLSKGHLPGDEEYGEALERCLKRVLATADMSEKAQFRGYMGGAGGGNMYSHSIGTLFLSEMSGIVDEEWQQRIDQVLPLATKVILDAQRQRKDGSHLGGWRYAPNANDSDLSCSGWALMALRSARLNGAELPDDAIEKAVMYVKRSQAGHGAFSYQGNGGNCGETLSGAAILCLELCGKHLDPASLKGSEFLKKTFRNLPRQSQAFYGLYYTSQGLFQIGGETWKEFEQWMYESYMKAQRDDGSWAGQGDNGSVTFSTAMTVLSFTVPYRMLPIYQRDESVEG